MAESFQTHGVKEVVSENSVDQLHLQSLAINGFTVLPLVVTRESLIALGDKLDNVYHRQVQEIGGEGVLDGIGDRQTVRLPLSYDDYFLQFAHLPSVIHLMNQALGDYYLLQLQNGILNLPGEAHYQHRWHRDLQYQHFTSSRPLAISALLCIDDFTRDNGCTVVLPGSHKSSPFPSEDYVNANQHAISASAGSVILMDGMLFHRAGRNDSGSPRRALNHVYTLPFIKQQINIASALQGHCPEDAFLRRLLGFESQVSESVMAWRQARLTP